MKYKEFVTTNIRLPREYLKALKHEAFQKEKSVSFLLRELVKVHLRGSIGNEGSKAKVYSIWDFPKFAKSTGDPQLASRVDEILYGGK